MAKVVSFSNQKGGVGKTTSCVNIAAQIANKGKKVLMIDMDPQGNATSGLGLPKSKIKKTITMLLSEDVPRKRRLLRLLSKIYPSFRQISTLQEQSLSFTISKKAQKTSLRLL